MSSSCVLLFYSASANALPTIETFKVGCSDEMLGRMDKLTAIFAECTEQECPLDWEEEEQVPCDWRPCLDPVLPYLGAVHDVSSCG